ncbi:MULTISPECIES: hypothetical protein [unclassified Bradyrhizobium]|uniref:hypothetical protein n=1 Tax=unclassified Bradyrhizobium TaxID=2631580 RepID=UPI0028E79C4E|nr:MULTISPECIES: hypothetical protein [unclassified Bradyrhizobium]
MSTRHRRRGPRDERDAYGRAGLVVPSDLQHRRRHRTTLAVVDHPSRDRALKDWHYRTPETGKWCYEFDRWNGEDQIILSAKPIEDTTTPRSVAIHRKRSEWPFRSPH